MRRKNEATLDIHIQQGCLKARMKPGSGVAKGQNAREGADENQTRKTTVFKLDAMQLATSEQTVI